jgi:hypothetical protein
MMFLFERVFSCELGRFVFPFNLHVKSPHNALLNLLFLSLYMFFHLLLYFYKGFFFEKKNTS